MAVINRGRDCLTLLRFLQRELNLPTKITHVQFVEAFAQLQTDAEAYEKELQDAFMENMKGQFKPE